MSRAGPADPDFLHFDAFLRRFAETLRESAMAMDANEIERLIKARIPDAEVTIRDLAGDGDHYAATVLAESFRGKSRVQQHQIVYEALKAEMGGKLHALALQTGTPDAAR
jgi:stress-induced morphogen